jgi:hypothetical protein
MATPKNPENPISEDVGLLPSMDYGYRLVPSKVEIQWVNGVITIGIFDKHYALTPQGINSQRLVINLEFDLTLAECEKLVQALKDNKVNTVMTPSSFIDPSGVLKEVVIYADSLEITDSVTGRQTISVSFVTDTASSVIHWRTSNFVDVDIIDADSEVAELSIFDIVYSDKAFYYIPRDVSAEEIEEDYDSDFIAAAKDIGKKWYLPLEVRMPIQNSIQPDYFVNDFQNSYPIRSWKGESTYDYQNIQISCESIHKRQLKCVLHFLEHMYGCRNFRIEEMMNDEYWWTCQQWQHSWVAGDYHSFAMIVGQNHLPKNFKK